MCRTPLQVLQEITKRKEPDSPYYLNGDCVAVVSNTLSDTQLQLIEDMMPAIPDRNGKLLLLVPGDDESVVNILAPLLSRYFVKVVRT